MKRTYQTGKAGPTHMELDVKVASPHLPLWKAEKKWRELGNPILEIKHSEITTVHQIEKIAYDNSEAAQGELVWVCDGCRAYSKSKAIIDAHERTCEAIERK